MKSKVTESIETDASFTNGHHHGKFPHESAHDHENAKLGRLDGVNRFGEDHPHPAHYGEDDHRISWSEDMRSEGHHHSDYTGIGPRHYVRRDELIKEDVLSVLREHPDIDSSHLSISVSQGVISLEGSVHSSYELHIINHIVSKIAGSKDLINQLIKTGDY